MGVKISLFQKHVYGLLMNGETTGRIADDLRAPKDYVHSLSEECRE